MQYAVLHLLALAAHGRVALRGREPVRLPPELDRPPGLSLLRFSHLYEQDGEWRRDPRADTASAWLEGLRATGHTRLKALHAPANQPLADWRTAGLVGGGGHWMLAATSPAGTDGWEAEWRPEREGDAAVAWRVEYLRVRRGLGPPPADPPLRHAAPRLDLALERIGQFARELGEAHWAELFRSARDTLAGRGPAGRRPPLHGAALSEDNARLMDAAQSAWVFGGMGSWCDVGFAPDRQAQGDALSAELHSAVVQALVCAANSAGATARWRWWH